MSKPLHVPAGEGPVYDLAGDLNRIVLDGKQTGGVAAVVDVSVLPGAGAPPHSDAREDSIWYVTAGVLDFEMEDGKVRVEAGDSLFVPRDTLHAFFNSGSSEARAILVAVPAGIEDFFREAAAMLPDGVPSDPPPPEAMQAFGELAARHGITIQPA